MTAPIDAPKESPAALDAEPAPLDACVAAPPAPAKTASPRIDFVDNLRVFIILVVLAHHAANPYGSPDFWYFKARGQRSDLVGLYLELAPSFTMAALLTFSGFLLPASYQRHGFSVYVREKLLRLGIPLFLGGMVMLPLLQYSYHVMFAYQGYHSFFDYYWNAWLALGEKPEGWNGPGWPDRNFGHLWYIEHLLFYALCYACWRRFVAPADQRRPTYGRAPTFGHIFLFAVGVTLATFFVRIWFPLNRVYALLGFLQIDMSHFPQWLPFFFVGLGCYKYGWIYTISRRTGFAWLAIGVGLVVLDFTLAFTPWAILQHSLAYAGGFNLPNFLKCLWESFFCVGTAFGLIVLFRETMNARTRLRRIMAENAYAVHVFHPPIIVGIQYLIDPFAIATVWKFVLCTLLGGVACFSASHLLIRRIPFAKRIL